MHAAGKPIDACTRNPNHYSVLACLFIVHMHKPLFVLCQCHSFWTFSSNIHAKLTHHRLVMPQQSRCASAKANLSLANWLAQAHIFCFSGRRLCGRQICVRSNVGSMFLTTGVKKNLPFLV